MTIPLQRYIGWDPTPEGVSVTFSLGTDEFHTELNMIEVRELCDDMEEANMLSRGNEKIECWAEEVQDGDKIRVGGDVRLVSSVLTERDNKVVIQFGENFSELILPADEQLTVWREVQ